MEEPVSGSGDPNGVLDYPYGLTASPGTAPGEMVLRWKTGSQFNIHWVYLSEADGSRGRYWPQPWTGSGVEEAELIVSGLWNGREYRFSVVGGYVRPDRSASFSYWSPWAYATTSGVATAGPLDFWGPPPPPPGVGFPLGPPINVRVNPVGNGLVNVGWDRVTGAAGYTIIAVNITSPAEARTESVNNPHAVAGQIGNLKAGAQYDIYVGVFDANLDFAVDFSAKERVTVE